MKKIKKESSVGALTPLPELPEAYDHIFNVERFERFLGRVLTMIETLGLNQTQEKAFKDIIKQEIWDLWEHPWGIHERFPGCPPEVGK